MCYEIRTEIDGHPVVVECHERTAWVLQPLWAAPTSETSTLARDLKFVGLAPLTARERANPGRIRTRGPKIERLPAAGFPAPPSARRGSNSQ
jgi:hypothetical protein